MRFTVDVKIEYLDEFSSVQGVLNDALQYAGACAHKQDPINLNEKIVLFRIDEVEVTLTRVE